MGIAPQPQTERNNRILDLHAQGATTLDLQKEFNLSAARIYQIINTAKRKLTKKDIV